MQKLFDISFPSKKHFSALKKMWNDAFGDSMQIIDRFFETAELQNIICAFCDDEPVSALYAVDSQVSVNGELYKAYYVYAVSTKKEFRGRGLSLKILEFLERTARERGYSYLFLVPADNGLFELYKKSGFQTCFTYKEEWVSENDFLSTEYNECAFDYEKYRSLKEKFIPVPYTFFTEQGFSSFYGFVGDDMKLLCIDSGYVVYETEGNKVIVHECIGDRQKLLSCIFSKINVDGVYVRGYSDENGKPYGMLKSLNGSPLFYNGFIGVSYGG
jgi:predicted acetyltransferase